MNFPKRLRFGGVIEFTMSTTVESIRILVRPVRFELTTFCSGGKRSIQTELRARCGYYSGLACLPPVFSWMTLRGASSLSWCDEPVR
jgi:hypothetical protein